MIFSLLAANSMFGFADDSMAAETCRIKVLDSAEIDSENIILGQIARLDSEDLQLIQRLKEIVIGKAPLPGKSRIITSDDLKTRLEQNGLSLAEISLQCPGKIEITRSYIEIDKQKIEDILSSFLYQSVLKENQTARIKNLCVPDGFILPKGHITYQVMPPRNTDFLGKIPLSIQFNVDEHYRKKVWTTATIEMLADVVVTTKPLGKHKPITADDIGLQRMDLANLASNVINDPETVIGKRTRNAIPTKTVLRTDLIELPPLVDRGDIVVIIAESKGLRVTALGKVKKRGRLGERIPVENFDSKKILYAQVIDSRTVKVEF